MSKTTLLLLPSPTHPNPIPLGSLAALCPSLHLTPASLMRCVRSAIIRVVFPPRQILSSFGYNEIKFQSTKSEKFFKEFHRLCRLNSYMQHPGCSKGGPLNHPIILNPDEDTQSALRLTAGPLMG